MAAEARNLGPPLVFRLSAGLTQKRTTAISNARYRDSGTELDMLPFSSKLEALILPEVTRPMPVFPQSSYRTNLAANDAEPSMSR